jgi:uncharacterized protein YchJ
MKRLFLLSLIIFSIAACAGVPKKGIVEDEGSESKIALLRERADGFWSAFVKEDYEKLFSFYDTFFQAKTNKYTFMASLGRIKYHSYEIKDVRLEGNIGFVTLNVLYSIPKFKFKAAEFSKEPTLTKIEEKWLFISDKWYKEYRDPDGDPTIIKY